MESFLRVGLMIFLSAEYYFCASEKNESTSVIERRMIGGRVAENGEFPFLIAIYEEGGFEGTFSLITSQTLIGAAHVVERRQSHTKIIQDKRNEIQSRMQVHEYQNKPLEIISHVIRCDVRINDIKDLKSDFKDSNKNDAAVD
ncbi:uncharacterized protein [Centruroides vittatus]|uniref:uncharacterized protein n=1 Tax=Centruroides vittatus TaxID=120091 RepID=UPI0035109C93